MGRLPSEDNGKWLLFFFFGVCNVLKILFIRYEDGRKLNKLNSMLDMIDSAVHLARGQLCDASKIVLEGASAGGLLVLGAAVLAPDLFAGVIADVPFCQVLASMLDKSLPLTCQELEEWGDPTDPAVREYMLRYSPYNLLQQGRRYPPVLMSGSTSDKQVLFHEPLMFAKKLEVSC